MATLQERAQQFMVLKTQLECAKDVATTIQKEFDHLRQVIIPEEMDAAGISSANFPGIGRLTVTADLFAGIQPEQQQGAYQWLIDHGHADLIKEYVHPSTLKAFIKELMQNGEVLPEEYFKATPYQRASVTKIPG
jgi:hypothetical protein